MSVFVISLVNGTADPTGLKRPAQHFENTLYQQSEAKRTTESSGLKQCIQQFEDNVSDTIDKGFNYVHQIMPEAAESV